MYSISHPQAYWPFHKPACKPNQFADAMEPADPKFAKWMRGHGKLAVIKDDEVERLERASKPGGWQGLSRQEVMDSMFGLVEPKPKGESAGTTLVQAASLQLGSTSKIKRCRSGS